MADLFGVRPQKATRRIGLENRVDFGQRNFGRTAGNGQGVDGHQGGLLEPLPSGPSSPGENADTQSTRKDLSIKLPGQGLMGFGSGLDGCRPGSGFGFFLQGGCWPLWLLSVAIITHDTNHDSLSSAPYAVWSCIIRGNPCPQLWRPWVRGCGWSCREHC